MLDVGISKSREGLSFVSRLRSGVRSHDIMTHKRDEWHAKGEERYRQQILSVKRQRPSRCCCVSLSSERFPLIVEKEETSCQKEEEGELASSISVLQSSHVYQRRGKGDQRDTRKERRDKLIFKAWHHAFSTRRMKERQRKLQNFNFSKGTTQVTHPLLSTIWLLL